MKTSTLINAINLKSEPIPEGQANRPGTRINVTKVTIHNTGNAKSGADAHAHSRFVRNKGYYEHNGKKIWVSWHYTVDDRVAIQQLPNYEKALHAKSGNSSSIGIEICMHKEIDQLKANDRAARLAAVLLHEYKLSIVDLVTHKEWTGKNCPVLLLEGNNWDTFKRDVKGYLDALNSKNENDIYQLLGEEKEFEFEGHMCWSHD